MAKCPVCKTECGENMNCKTCGFSDVNRIFINRDEAIQWEQSVLLPYKKHYYSTLDIEHVLKIKGNRLIKYYKSSKEPKVFVPKYVTNMSPAVFHFCDKIKEVYLSDNITELPFQTFIGCSSLEKIHLPENLTYIPEGAFVGCNNLKSIYIPDSVKSIHDKAFMGCYNLNEIIISSRNKYIKSIDGFILSNGMLVKMPADSMLKKVVSIPEGVTSIESGSLSGHRNLEMILLPESLEYIGLHSFYGFSKLQKIRIPCNVRYIGPNAFAHCDSIKEVTVDERNEVFSCIGNCIIENDEIVQGFPTSEIPQSESVSKISIYSFHSIKREKPLFIPSNIKQIDARAFDGDFDIICEAECKPVGWNSNWCDKSHKGNVFFVMDDGSKILADRDMIEGK